MESGASSRGSNTLHAGGSLNRAVNPGRFFLACSFFNPVPACTADFSSLRFAGFFRCGFRLQTKLLPSLERKYFFTLPEAGKIEAAIFASPPFRAQMDLEGHPSRRIRVGFSRPRIQVHAPAKRAPCEKQIAPHNYGREEPFLAVQASIRRYQAEQPGLLGKATHPRRTQKAASTFRTGDRHRSGVHRYTLPARNIANQIRMESA
jgi:hypothetical protein